MERFNSYRDPIDKLIRCTECGQSLELCQCEDYSMLSHDRLNSPEQELLRFSTHILDQLRLEKPEFQYGTLQMTKTLAEVIAELYRGLEGEQINLSELHHRIGIIIALCLRLWTEGDSTVHFNP